MAGALLRLFYASAPPPRAPHLHPEPHPPDETHCTPSTAAAARRLDSDNSDDDDGIEEGTLSSTSDDLSIGTATSMAVHADNLSEVGKDIEDDTSLELLDSMPALHEYVNVGDDDGHDDDQASFTSDEVSRPSEAPPLARPFGQGGVRLHRPASCCLTLKCFPSCPS